MTRCIHCGAPDARSQNDGRPKCADMNGCLLRTCLNVDLVGQALGVRPWLLTDRWFPVCWVMVAPGVRVN